MEHDRIWTLIIRKLTHEASKEELLELEQLTKEDPVLSSYLQTLEGLNTLTGRVDPGYHPDDPGQLSQEQSDAAYRRLATRIALQDAPMAKQDAPRARAIRIHYPRSSMLKSYIKIAWRNLLKHKTSTSINMLGLAIGISACLIIYLVTSFELSYDNFHPGKERIYRVVSEWNDKTGKSSFWPRMPDRTSRAIGKEFSGLESIASISSYYASAKIYSAGRQVKIFETAKAWEEPSDIMVAQPGYFAIFRYEWLAGNETTALDRPFRLVLTESKARAYFGSLAPAEMIGREVIYNDSLRVTVSGIVKDWNKNTDLPFSDFISFSTIDHSFLKNPGPAHWELFGYEWTFVKLAKGATPAQFEAQAAPMVKIQFGPEYVRRLRLHLQPLSDLHFDAKYEDLTIRKAHLPTLYGLMGIAAFILILAAFNFINLSTAQSTRRTKEIGIRKVLGSSRTNLVFQFLSEAFILTSLAVLLSLLIVNPVLNIFRGFIPPGVTLNLADPSTLIFLLIVTLATALLAGFYPARVLSSLLPALSLKGQGTQFLHQKNYLRKSLIVFQFTISLLFIVGTIIVGGQVRFMLNKDMGFSRDAIVNFYTNEDFEISRKRVLTGKIRELSGIERVSIGSEPPVRDNFRGGLIKRMDKDMQVSAAEREGDENYIPLYGLKLIAGRNFRVLQSDTISEFLVNETCAKQLGFAQPANALGHLISTGNGTTGQIVGVLADFYSQSLHAPLSPVYIFSSDNSRLISVKLSTQGRQISDFTTTMTEIKKLWKEAYPNEKFEYHFFDESVARFYDKEEKTSRIMHAAMVIAIFISCMGLFGLVTFTAEQRTKEIGIRKVLGASVSGIITLLSKDFLKLVLISIAISTPIAWWLTSEWLHDFAYRIPISGWVFVQAGLASLLIALFTVSFQAIRAAIANPVKSLKNE